MTRDVVTVDAAELTELRGMLERARHAQAEPMPDNSTAGNPAVVAARTAVAAWIVTGNSPPPVGRAVVEDGPHGQVHGQTVGRANPDR